jgi:hypothetical protein
MLRRPSWCGLPARPAELRFTRTFDRYYTCGSEENVDYYISATRELQFHPTKMELIGGEWIATALEGFEVNRGTRGCGLSGEVPSDRCALRARLVHP